MAKKKSTKAKSAKKSAAKPVAKPVNTQDLSAQVREEIWPVERAVLFRPERLRYVRKLIEPKGCVFCQAVDAGPSAESLLLYKGDHAIVVLNKYPYNSGHVLVLPRRHCGDFLELTDVEHFEINLLLRRVVEACQKVYQPAGFNVGLNLGAASGAGIPQHLHYHVVPRWAGDTNFFALLAETKVVVENLEQTYERLLPYFDGQK